jgi:primase-polymerase (primpol)-like protein
MTAQRSGSSGGAGRSSSYADIPKELRDRPQWVVWRYEQRKDKNGQPKPTKVPYQPADPGVNAKSNDPATWGAVEQAAAVEAFDGIGFVFAAADPYCGIDLDDCRDPITGAVHPAATSIVLGLDSYTEISPSGTGLHVIVRATLADLRDGRGCSTTKTPWGGKLELYDRDRFFTVTGDVCSLSRTEVHHG